MRKIPTLFVRDPATIYRHVRNEVNSGCEWVLNGEGVATRKYDGTCCRITNESVPGRRRVLLWRRHEVKPGKATPERFEQVEHDETTGKTVGWVPCDRSNPSDRWHFEALDQMWEAGLPLHVGTAELVGPKIQGNPEGFVRPTLIFHDEAVRLEGVPRDLDGLRVWLLARPYEGIVWHRPDGRMAKLKKRDFPQTPGAR